MPNFNHLAEQNKYLSEPGQHINPLAIVDNGGASSRHYRVIGVGQFPGGDNRIYFDVFDLNGQRITPVYLDWNWENSNATPTPAVGDKANEPSGNLDQIHGVHIWLEVRDFPSERITIPPPDVSSWYVVFQLTDIATPEPEPEPTPDPDPDPPPEADKPPAMPVSLTLESITSITISLKWSVSDRLAERFKVSWSVNDNDWQHLIAQSMAATIPDLSPDTLYFIKVQAVNQFGESAPAEIPAKTAKMPDNPPPDPPPDNPGSAGTWRVAISPNQTMVVPLKGDIVDQPDLHTSTTSYVLIQFSLPELKRIIADAEVRGDDFVELGIPLVLRSEYKF